MTVTSATHPMSVGSPTISVRLPGPPSGPASHTPVASSGAGVTTFDELYEAHFSFVWRSARRLGAPEASLDDVVQEVFMVVHRRFATFEGRSSLKTWLFGITLRVVRDHRRAGKKHPAPAPVDPDAVTGASAEATMGTVPGPAEAAERGEAVRVLHQVLDVMDDERRAIFVMAELEQIPVVEIAQTLGLGINSAYSRLRAAREDFEAAVQRHRARDEWRLR